MRTTIRTAIICLALLTSAAGAQAQQAATSAPPATRQIAVDSGQDYVSPSTQALLDRRAALSAELKQVRRDLKALGR